MEVTTSRDWSTAQSKTKWMLPVVSGETQVLEARIANEAIIILADYDSWYTVLCRLVQLVGVYLQPHWDRGSLLPLQKAEHLSKGRPAAPQEFNVSTKTCSKTLGPFANDFVEKICTITAECA